MKMRITKILSILIAAALLCNVGYSASEETGPPKDGKKGKESGKSDSPFKPFNEVVKDTQSFEGLFTFYLAKDGQVYLEIHPNQLDSLFQVTMQLSRGIGDQGILGGTPLDDYAFEFHRANNEVQFIKKNTYFRAAPDSPLSRSVPRDFGDSILAGLKIVSIRDEKQSLLVDAGDLFMSDLPNLARILNLSLKGGHYSPESSKSSIKKIEAFPLNDEVEVEADFATASPPKEAAFLDTLPDWRNIPLGVHYSFSSLPKESYTPRLADDRIGYFTVDMKDFSSEEPDSPIRRYIYRWNMAKKPIVFWIENTTPVEYRQAIKEAVLEWNKAFAEAGIEHALDVQIQPDNATWSSSDIRYNVIHWLSPSDSKFAGLGPSHVNPLTGEIYNASVSIDGESIRYIKRIYRYEINLNRPTKLILHPPAGVCALPSLKQLEGERAALALWLDAPDLQGFKVPEAFLRAYIKELVMHEVGHCLGLRHNFHASTLLSLKDVQDTSITQRTGLSASVMDYLPVNLAPPGEKQGDYFSSTIGAYDYWAIKYGYLPEEEQLKKIASESGLAGHIYSTDEDTFSPYHIDPLSMVFDLTNDSLGFAEGRFRIYRKVWTEIPKKLPLSGESFSQTRRAFDLIFSGYSSFSTLPVQYIGGQYFDRAHAEDLNAKPPLSLIPKSKQIRALDILDHYIFSENAFSFSSESLNKLAPDRRVDRFSDLQPYITPFDYPLLEKVSDIQEGVLKQIFRPVLLWRLLENETKVNHQNQLLTLTDLFEWMTTHFWSELGNAITFSATRRNLQQAHLRRLVDLVLRPKPQMFGLPEIEIPPIPIAAVPEEARGIAEYELEQIKVRIRIALKSRGHKMDLATRSHLNSSLRLINKTLNAKVEQSLGGESSGPPEQE